MSENWTATPEHHPSQPFVRKTDSSAPKLTPLVEYSHLENYTFNFLSFFWYISVITDFLCGFLTWLNTSSTKSMNPSWKCFIGRRWRNLVSTFPWKTKSIKKENTSTTSTVTETPFAPYSFLIVRPQYLNVYCGLSCRFIDIEMKFVKFEDSLFVDCYFENIRSTDTLFENCTIRNTLFYDTGKRYSLQSRVVLVHLSSWFLHFHRLIWRKVHWLYIRECHFLAQQEGMPFRLWGGERRPRLLGQLLRQLSGVARKYHLSTLHGQNRTNQDYRWAQPAYWVLLEEYHVEININ